MSVKSYFQEIVDAACSGGSFDYAAFVRRLRTQAPGSDFTLEGRTITVKILGSTESVQIPDGCEIVNG